MKISSHEDLKVYKESMDLVIKIYKLTNSFPSHEKFGLMSQMRRAAVSVPSNIAEGAKAKPERADPVSLLQPRFDYRVRDTA